LIKDVDYKENFSIKMREKSFSIDLVEERQATYPATVNNTEVWNKRLSHFHTSSCLEYATKEVGS